MSDLQATTPSDTNEMFSRALLGTSIDVGAYHVGVVYAQALLDAAEKSVGAEAVVAELDTLVEEILLAHPRLTTFLGSEMISVDVRRGVMQRIMHARFSPLFTNFVRVVVEHRRGQCLRAIHYAAHELLDKLRGRVRVEVTSAVVLDDGASQQLTAQLRQSLGAEPVLERRVDPELIGGVVLRIGDTVYDGSVSARLERMRDQLIHRSVHEIQSRRDRFSSTAGN